jgi:hypothetical protein
LARRLLELDERACVEAGEAHAVGKSPRTTLRPRRRC